MSHLHIPDGVLPAWLWIGALIATLLLVVLFSRQLERRRRMLPMVAVLSALALVIMQVHIGPLHINLSALAGIVAGPGLGFLAVFVANFFSAIVLGHGGLTVLGVNSLLVGSEALVAGAVFALMGGARRLLVNGAGAVAVALVVSTLLVLAVGAIAGQSLEAMVLDHDHNHGNDHDHDHDHNHEVSSGFFTRFVSIIAFLLLPWMAMEMTLSLGAMAFIRRVRGQWFEQEE